MNASARRQIGATKRRSTVGVQAKAEPVDEHSGDTLDPEELTKIQESMDVADLLKPKKYNDKLETPDLNNFYKNDGKGSRLVHLVSPKGINVIDA